MLSWIVVAAIVIGGYYLLRSLGWKDKGIEQAYGKGAMLLISPALRELGYSPETAIYSVYRDRKLLIDPAGVVLVGVADHASGNKMGFAFEAVPGKRLVDGTMLSPNLASHHQSRAQRAMLAAAPLVTILRTEEEQRTLAEPEE
jgi:hypothetical protein